MINKSDNIFVDQATSDDAVSDVEDNPIKLSYVTKSDLTDSQTKSTTQKTSKHKLKW